MFQYLNISKISYTILFRAHPQSRGRHDIVAGRSSQRRGGAHPHHRRRHQLARRYQCRNERRDQQDQGQVQAIYQIRRSQVLSSVERAGRSTQQRLETHSRGQVGLVHVRKPAVSTQHRKEPARFRTGFRLGEDARQRGSQSTPSLLSSSPKLESPSPFGEMRLQRGLHHVRLFIFSHENCL